MFPEISIIFGLYFGAAFGSFLNVVIYRLPRKMSLTQPPSHCPSCKHRLGLLDLFPLFSFLLAGAKCRYCKAPIGWRYFMVEAITAVVWGGFWWQNLIVGSDPARFLAYAAFGTILIGCIFIDIYHYIIPDSLNAALLFVGLIFNAWLIAQGQSAGWFQFAGITLPSAIAGAWLGVFVFWFIGFVGSMALRRDAMGHGDLKLARGIGAVLLPVYALISFGVAVALGAVLGIVILIVRRAMTSSQEDETEEEEYVEEPPMTAGEWFKALIYYVLALDVVALWSPGIEAKWFGESETPSADDEDDWEPGFTHIPFGPYLAAGAILAAFFGPQFQKWITAYWDWATRK